MAGVTNGYWDYSDGIGGGGSGTPIDPNDFIPATDELGLIENEDVQTTVFKNVVNPFNKTNPWFMYGNSSTVLSVTDNSYTIPRDLKDRSGTIAKMYSEGILGTSYIALSDDCLECQPISIPTDGSFFVSFWVKTCLQGNGLLFFGDNSTSSGGLFFGWNNTTTLRLGFTGNVTSITPSVDNGTFRDKWTHYAVLFKSNGISAKGETRFFINGGYEGNDLMTYNSNYTNGGITLIGGAKNGNVRTTGLYSNFRVSSTSDDTFILTDNEVNLLYEMELNSLVG